MKENRFKYIIAFVSQDLTGKIFLAFSANIDSICYSENPELPGTTKIELSKGYDTIEKAKEDIYKLRYHYRQFLGVLTCIIKIEARILNNNVAKNNFTHYSFEQLKSLESINEMNDTDSTL